MTEFFKKIRSTRNCLLLIFVATMLIGFGFILIFLLVPKGQEQLLNCWTQTFSTVQTCTTQSWRYLPFWSDSLTTDNYSAMLQITITMPNQSIISLMAPSKSTNYSQWLIINKSIDCWIPNDFCSEQCEQLGISNTNIWLGTAPTDSSNADGRKTFLVGMGVFIIVIGVIFVLIATFFHHVETKKNQYFLL